MNDDFSALRAYAAATSDYYPPRATVSLAETTLMTPTSPESFSSVKDEDDQGERRTTKKRKSWGQELPTPKTNLPPRKRAKTEDEKEQRRIERVLRNRQAAQSSRERKRQEVEKLEGEKMSIERQNYLLKQRLMAVEHEKFRLAQENAKMAAQLTAMKNRSSSQRPAKAPTPSCAPSPSLTADLLQHDRVIKQELEEHPFSLPSPQNTLDPRSSFSSASSNASSRSPSPSHMDFNGSATSPDMTQHPAAMLCGLQCQFGAAWRPLETIPPTHPAEVHPLSDIAFGRLFDTPSSPQPALHFFEDGLPPDADGDDTNAFLFDSMVDLDAGEPANNDTTNEFLDFNNNGDLHTNTLPSTTASFDFPHQLAATSSSLQPRLGASS
ncbi:hypothetical protein MMC06_001313 [Schaereria dolodes]|nr:hypothetical protein [Schaereria dolodes]